MKGMAQLIHPFYTQKTEFILMEHVKNILLSIDYLN